MALKKKDANRGHLLKPAKVFTTIDAFEHPIFCFKYLNCDYDLNRCTTPEKVALIEQIIRFSNMIWNEIQLAPRHGLGSEKIAVNCIRPGLPAILTADVKHLLALRFLGKAPFVGWRNKFVFHVLYIDRAFELYKH